MLIMLIILTIRKAMNGQGENQAGKLWPVKLKWH